MRTSHPLPVVLLLATLLDHLFDSLQARYGKFPLGGELTLHLWRRFAAIKTRFARLAGRLAAGKGFPARKPRPAGARAPRTMAAPRFRLGKWVTPEFGWLVRVMTRLAVPAADFSGALRTLVTTDPDMRALLAATPATARLLRPLCWMLGVTPPRPPEGTVDAGAEVDADVVRAPVAREAVAPRRAADPIASPRAADPIAPPRAADALAPGATLKETVWTLLTAAGAA